MSDPSADRLESWKEIAGYLGREVRTVQLWEKNEGLPIHRHQHARQGSVYAFKSELDAWRQARATVPAEDPVKDTPWNTRRILLVVFGVLALVEVTVLTGVTTGWFKGSEAPMRGVPLTSALGEETEPNFSPEGTRVAYSWNGEKQNNFDIYVKQISPGPPLRLTTDPARDMSPAWSRDGSSIAFLRELPDGRARVIVIPSLGGPERMAGEVLRWPHRRRPIPARISPGPPTGKGSS